MEDKVVNFRTAQLTKEKGLNLEFCNTGWHGDFGVLKGDNYPFLGTYSYYTSIYCNNKDEHQIQRPTQALLQRWLREAHKIYVHPQPNFNSKRKVEKFYSDIFKNTKQYQTEGDFDTYEEALEDGLQEALKLIK